MSNERLTRLKTLITKKHKDEKTIAEIRLLCEQLGKREAFNEFMLQKENEVALKGNYHKVSSFLDNAKIYGPGFNVAGGTSVEYKYHIELIKGKSKLYIKCDDGTLTFTDKISDCSYFRWDEVTRIKNTLENNGFKGDLKFIPKSTYCNLRD